MQAANNRIKLEVRGAHDYYGTLFAGEKQVDNRIILDTMSSWTTINHELAEGETPVVNFYNPEDSHTASLVYKDPITKTPDDRGLNFGSTNFQGTVYSDDVCLI